MKTLRITAPPQHLFLGLLAGGFILLGSVRAAPPPVNPPWRTWESARVRLFVERAAAMHHVAFDRFALSEAMAREQDEVGNSLALLNQSITPTAQPGIRLEAYLSEIDDSPQPFWRYLPAAPVPSGTRRPLLVFLHGYNPEITLASVPGVPACLTNLAERTSALIAAPFGRGNTDYQHIGEQDVFQVIAEMDARFGVDPERIVLFGVSMGGLGAWCMGARWADRFNALVIVCGRGDFYVWHKLRPDELPGWHRELVDTQFATRYLDRLLDTPILGTHGPYDDVVTYEQGRFPPDELLRLGAGRTRFITFPQAGHDVFALSWNHPPVQAFLQEVLTRAFPKPRGRPGVRPGFTGSRIQDAFLDPFLFVGADDGGTGASVNNLRARADEWQRFAFARPRQAMEATLAPAQAARHNLFIFGEPEDSRLVSTILAAGGIVCTPDAFVIAGRRLPREGNGLWFAGRNPFNRKRTAVVQVGLPWGERLADNHRYDRIPDVIVYTAEADRWGTNVALAAGFIEPDASIRWADPSFTEAIRRPPDPPPDEDWTSIGYGHYPPEDPFFPE